MATTSFNKHKDVTEETAPLSVTPVSDKQLATVTRSAGSESSGVEGEITSGDVKFPRINLVQKIGPLSEVFDAGALVFNKEVVLCAKDSSLDITVLRLKKQYQEVLPFDSEEHPRLFNTMAEVREVGGALFKGEGDVLFAEVAHIQVAVKKPANCESELEVLFCEEHEGEHYALALWTLAKTAYTSAGKPIITKATSQLKSTGLLGGKWGVTIEKRSSDKYTWYVPIFKLVGMHTPEAQEFFQSLLVR